MYAKSNRKACVPSIKVTELTNRQKRAEPARRNGKKPAKVAHQGTEYPAREGERRWPQEILLFRGIPDWPAFELARQELMQPDDTLQLTLRKHVQK